jgi:ABC-type bacteriocin/lantibiotic exporter with double-glycine peptidase domain
MLQSILNRWQIQERLQIAAKILRSFLPWRRHAKKTGKGSLKVKAHRQWTTYSCTASVAQMVTHYYGIRLGHRKAIALTACRPDGATLGSVARALKRTHGLRPRTLRTRLQVRCALRRGEPVMTNDEFTYTSDHAILLVGETPKGFWIADPAIGEVYWRHERRFFAGADQFIAIAEPS